MNKEFINWLEQQVYLDMDDEELGPCLFKKIISISNYFECKWRPISC